MGKNNFNPSIIKADFGLLESKKHFSFLELYSLINTKKSFSFMIMTSRQAVVTHTGIDP